MLRGETNALVVLLRGDHEVARWPVERGGRPVLEVVEELARLQLAARRLGCEIRLRNPCARLAELLELVGLKGVLTDAD